MGAYSDPPDPQTVFKGPNSKGEEGEAEAKERGREADRGEEGCLPSNWGLWTRQWRREGREKGKEGSLSWASRHFLFSTLSIGKRLLVYRTVYRVGNVAAEKAMQSIATSENLF